MPLSTSSSSSSPGKLSRIMSTTRYSLLAQTTILLLWSIKYLLELFFSVCSISSLYLWKYCKAVATFSTSGRICTSCLLTLLLGLNITAWHRASTVPSTISPVSSSSFKSGCGYLTDATSLSQLGSTRFCTPLGASDAVDRLADRPLSRLRLVASSEAVLGADLLLRSSVESDRSSSRRGSCASVSVGEPFELTDGGEITLWRLSFRDRSFFIGNGSSMCWKIIFQNTD
ncbi:hypothetical protein OGATHE_006257 [Ogataea polymorpha]|uniref:Uncharacterized protein n=1 Tax=Ogataea polymorpha TaxID=460523 RepID=A0A9P8SXZ9_9ASCO|nr:hypothetical protein OGATHE_006257 [Ogataea polymorpha]